MNNWRDIAAAADEVRRNTKYGEREAEMSRLAPGVDVDMVRRTLRVADFLDEVTKGDAKLARTLHSQQFYHLEILARWAALDRKAAIKAAHQMLKNKPAIRTLQKSFDAFRRQKGDAGRITRLTPTQPLLTAISGLLKGKLSDPQIRPTVLGGRFVDITLKLDRKGLPSSKVAAMLVGPYSTPRHYTKQMHSVLLNAWAIAWAFDDVVLALPEEAPMEAYRRWLTDAQGELDLEPAAGPRVHLLAMKANFYPQREKERK